MSVISDCSRKKWCRNLHLTPLDFWGEGGLYPMCRFCRKKGQYSGTIFNDASDIKATVYGEIFRCLQSDHTHGQESDQSNGVELKCLVRVHPTANLEDLADEIKSSIESADGYSYRYQKTVKYQNGSRRCIYWCCQRFEYAKHNLPVAYSSRNRINTNQYDCKGYIVIHTPPDTRQQPFLQIRYQHGCFHPKAGNFKVSDNLGTFIRERVNSTNATAKHTFSDFIRIKEESPDDELITQAQEHQHEIPNGEVGDDEQASNPQDEANSTVPRLSKRPLCLIDHNDATEGEEVGPSNAQKKAKTRENEALTMIERSQEHEKRVVRTAFDYLSEKNVEELQMKLVESETTSRIKVAELKLRMIELAIKHGKSFDDAVEYADRLLPS
ncbi:hypothetical protein BKA69DRAFT_1096222 [Paraphysoderma sedebokerense]|nr:hypothetical protein BKA69DRAFT_1096222 [Paraphysoderma sedebokerense]